MATLETQYQNYLKENFSPVLTYDEWLDKIHPTIKLKTKYPTIKKKSKVWKHFILL